MHDVVSLLISIAPLVLFASISPIVVLNASTAVTQHGQRGGWQFVAGQAAVLIVLGVAFVGLLGNAASTFAERQIASKTVDRFLGIALFFYGCLLAWQQWRRSRTRDDDEAGATVRAAESPGAHSMLGWGAIGMATNFTTLPVFAAVSQRIGAAAGHWYTALGLEAAVIACCLIPAWVPVVVHRVAPRRARVSARLRRRITAATGWASTAACLVCGVILWATTL